MKRITIQTIAIVFACCLTGVGQTPKNLTKDNLSFDYPDGWTLADDSNSDAQQFTLTRSDSDVQIRVFVHKGRITAEKLPDAKKAFIDPYITASLGGETGASKIYWALLGQRVVVLTLFGPDRDTKQFSAVWDLVRTTLKIEEPKPAASPSPKP